MKTKILFLILLLAAVIALAACTTEERKDQSLDGEVKTELVERTQLPAWLADYAGYLECSPEGKELISSSGSTASGIYRFKWNGNTYYEIFFPNQNKLHSNLYTNEGVPVELTEQYLKDFSENVYDWTIIYLFHPNQERFWEYPKNVYHTLSDIEFEKDSALTDFLNRTCHHHVNKFKIRGSNICYIVRNEKQLRTLYDGNIPLPEIDFSRYSLFVGNVYISDEAELKRVDFTGSTATSIARQEDNVIHLHFENIVPLFQQEESRNQENYYFWGLFPTLEEDVSPSMEVKCNNQTLTGKTIDCYVPDVPVPDYPFPDSSDESRLDWYLDLYTTPDGMRHQVSHGYGNYWFSMSISKTNIENGIITGVFGGRANQILYQVDFELEDYKEVAGDTLSLSGNIKMQLSHNLPLEDGSQLEDGTPASEYLLQNLDRARKVVYSPEEKLLSFFISDTERFEFRHQDYYPTGEEYDMLKGVRSFIEQNKQPVSLAVFKKYAVAKDWCNLGWVIEEIHEMYEDGSYVKSDIRMYKSTGGGSEMAFEFCVDTLRKYYFGGAYRDYYIYRYENKFYEYNEMTQELCLSKGSFSINSWTTSTVLSLNDREMRLLRHGRVQYFGQHSCALSGYLYMILRRMTENELKYYKDKYIPE